MINVAQHLYEFLTRLVETTGNYEAVPLMTLSDQLYDQLAEDCGASHFPADTKMTFHAMGMETLILRQNPYPLPQHRSLGQPFRLANFTYSPVGTTLSNDPVQGPPYAAPDPLPTKAPPPVEEKPRKKFREFL